MNDPAALRALGFERLQHRETLTSAVTTSWGVDWDEDMIARDLLQNFFDADRDRLDQIRITVNGPTASVTAPTAYDLKRLYYLGSTKGPDDIGQYGEGFKAATVSLFRKFPQALLIAASGDQVVRVSEGEAVDGTGMRPLVYEYHTNGAPVAGNRLFLRGVSRQMLEAMQGGLTHFFYAGNPLIGEECAADWQRTFVLYRSHTPDGHLFYRNLRRGRIPHLPVVLAVTKAYQTIEKKIQHDRDRKAFGEELQHAFYALLGDKFFRGHSRAVRTILESARPLWEQGRGHPLLEAIARYRRYGGWDETAGRAVFGDGYFARSPRPDGAEWQIRYAAVEEEWRQQGRKELPEYFSTFGVPSAKVHLDNLAAKAKREAREQGHRPISPAESRALAVLTRVVRKLAPAVMAHFDSRKTTYSVAETEVLLGELKQARAYRSQEVFLAASVFETDFPRAFAVFLHEHAHLFGYGSRAFTDALTELIEDIVRCRGDLDSFETAWDEACEAVLHEREAGRTGPELDYRAALERMDRGELLDLLEAVPPLQLEGLLRRHTRSAQLPKDTAN
jgi:hypothetical protein